MSPATLSGRCIAVTRPRAQCEALAAGIEHVLARGEAEKAEAGEAGRAWAATFTWDTIGAELRSRLDALG